MENFFFTFAALIIIANFVKFAYKLSNKKVSSTKRPERSPVVKPFIKNVQKAVKRAEVMATPAEPEFHPAFLEEKDYSEFEMPTYLRQKHERKLAEAKAVQAKHQTPAKSAHSAKPKAAKTPRNPKISFEEFRANAAENSQGNSSTAHFVEV